MSTISRILIVHPHLSVIGGSEELTRMLIEELHRMGIEVGVVTGSPSPLPVKSRLWVIEARTGESLAERIADAFLTMAEAIDSFSPDAVLVMIHEPLYAVMAKMAKPGIPVGIYIHFPIEEEVNEKNLEDFLKLYRFPIFEPKMYTIPDVHMTNSLYTARTLYKLFGIESHVVYPCISRDYLESEPDLDKQREPIVLTVGRIVPHKNHKLVLSVFREYVRRKVPNARLIIVGSRDVRYMNYFNELKKLVEETPGAELIVEPSRRELLKLYREASVYVHARIGEHFGMAPLEAMSQGVIVVAHESTGLTEILEPGLDLLVYKRTEELGEVLVKALTMPPQHAVKMRKRARSKTLFFSPHRFAREVLGYMLAAVEARDRLKPITNL